jgi:GNAT superfamily N-acetyltransferase
MWREARASDDGAIVEMCLELNREDPGAVAVPPEQIRRTLAVLRDEPWRGRAVILELEGSAIGYAFLIAFWSNELGGEVCEVDELFVASDHRRRGYGRSLFAAIEDGTVWPRPAVAIALGTTPSNAEARRLYERLGFVPVGIAMVRRSVA